jgi:hypothetical protein
MIILTASLWLISLALTLVYMRYFARHGFITALAVLAILIPQVYARPLLFFLGLDTPYPYNYFGETEWGSAALALLITTLWAGLFFASHHIFYQPLKPFRRLLPDVRCAIKPARLLTVAFGVTALGVMLTWMEIAKQGSLVRFIYAVKIGKEMAGSYVIREISVVAAIMCILAIIICVREARTLRSSRRRWQAWFAFGLFIVNLAFNYAWGNRYNIAMLMAVFGLGWHYSVTRLNLYRVGMYVLLAGTALQLLKGVRNAAVEDALGREIIRGQSFWLDVSTSLHFNQFDAFMLALRDAGELFPIREGKDFINGLLSWVPRAWFPEKETFHIGGWFRRLYEPTKANGWPITTMGSWYVNFGFFGIVAGAVISGMVAAVFDGAYRRAKLLPWHAVIGSGLAFLMFDGGVPPGFVQKIFLLVIPLAALSFVLSTRIRLRAKPRHFPMSTRWRRMPLVRPGS